MIPQEMTRIVKDVQRLANDRAYAPNLVWKSISDLEMLACRNYLVDRPGIRTLLEQAKSDLDFALRTMADRTKNMSAITTFLHLASEKTERALAAYTSLEGGVAPTKSDTVSPFRVYSAIKSKQTDEYIDHLHWALTERYRNTHRMVSDDGNNMGEILYLSQNLNESLWKDKNKLSSVQQGIVFKLKGVLDKAVREYEKYFTRHTHYQELYQTVDNLRNQADTLHKQLVKKPDEKKRTELNWLSKDIDAKETQVKDVLQEMRQLGTVIRQLIEQAGKLAADAQLKSEDWQKEAAGVNQFRVKLNELRLRIGKISRETTDSRTLLTQARLLKKLVDDLQNESVRVDAVLPEGVMLDASTLVKNLIDDLNIMENAPSSRQDALSRIQAQIPLIEGIINGISSFQRQGKTLKQTKALPLNMEVYSVPREKAPPAEERTGSATVSRRPAQFDTAGRVNWEVWLFFNDDPKIIWIVGRLGKSWNDYRQAAWWLRQHYPALSFVNTATFGAEIASAHHDNAGRLAPVPDGRLQIPPMAIRATDNFRMDWVADFDALKQMIQYVRAVYDNSELLEKNNVYDVRQWQDNTVKPLGIFIQHREQMLRNYPQMSDGAQKQIREILQALQAAQIFAVSLAGQFRRLKTVSPHAMLHMMNAPLFTDLLGLIRHLETALKLSRWVSTRSLPETLGDMLNLIERNPAALSEWEVEVGHHAFGDNEPQDILEIEMLIDRDRLLDIE